MVEFNLSKKQKHTNQYSDCRDNNCRICSKCYKEDDVKEFIRLLKEEVMGGIAFSDYENKPWTLKNILRKEIDKLAGDKLV